jgi:hypothetical protein
VVLNLDPKFAKLPFFSLLVLIDRFPNSHKSSKNKDGQGVMRLIKESPLSLANRAALAM